MLNRSIHLSTSSADHICRKYLSYSVNHLNYNKRSISSRSIIKRYKNVTNNADLNKIYDYDVETQEFFNQKRSLEEQEKQLQKKRINYNIDRDIFGNPYQLFNPRLNPILSNLNIEDQTLIGNTATSKTATAQEKQQYNQQLLSILKKYNFKFDNDIIPSSILESLTFNTKDYSYSHLNRYFHFGNLIYNTVISELVRVNKTSDEETKMEYKSIVRGSFFLRKRCEMLGLSDLICGMIPTEQLKFKSFYARHYHYRCLLQLIGAIYLEKGLEVVTEFIQNHLLQSNLFKMEQFILDYPESVVLKKFYQYKIEPPLISINSPGRCPLYHGVIISGRKKLVETYGIDENEVRCNSFDLLNIHCSSITSVLSLLVSENPIKDMNIDYSEYFNNNNNKEN